MNPIQEKFQRGELSVGTFTQLRQPCGCGVPGPDGPGLRSHRHGALRRGRGVSHRRHHRRRRGEHPPLVRINEISRSAVLQPLDYGARGLIVPAVETVEQVEQLVRYAKFPRWATGATAPTRDGGWGFDASPSRGRRPTLPAATVRRSSSPSARPGAAWSTSTRSPPWRAWTASSWGPSISPSPGHPHAVRRPPAMKEAMARILDACHRNHKMAFIFCGDAEAARQWAAEGYDSVTTGLDALMLMDAYRDMVRTIRG